MRKRKPEEHLNHEAWAIPYADLMTLLLAFFVVMYAVSVVNEGKYRVMSESLIQAFNGPTSGSLKPPVPVPSKPNTSAVVSVGRPVAVVTHAALPIALHSPSPVNATKGLPAAKSLPAVATQNLDIIETQVRRALQPLIDRKLVVVRHKPDGLEIEIRTDILFPSGAAQLSSSADKVLQHLAVILAPFPNPLRVEGFTDNVPISTPQYPSNWELSAGRAASVARLFALSGVAPDRLGIIGWGDVRPLADNATSEGRNQNRRVLVVVMSEANGTQRYQSDAAHVREIAAAAAPPQALGAQKRAPGHATAGPDGEQTRLLPQGLAAIAARPAQIGQAAAAAAEPTQPLPTRVSPDR